MIHGLDLSDVSLRPSIHCSPLRRQRRFGSGSPLHACTCLSHDPFPMVRACPIPLNRCRSVDDNVGDSHYIRTSLNEVCTLERTFGSSRPISCLKSRPALFISCHLESHNSQSTPRCLRTDVNVDHSPNDSIFGFFTRQLFLPDTKVLSVSQRAPAGCLRADAEARRVLAQGGDTQLPQVRSSTTPGRDAVAIRARRRNWREDMLRCCQNDMLSRRAPAREDPPRCRCRRSSTTNTTSI